MKDDRIKEHKIANEFLKKYLENRGKYAIIHFARENHFDERYPKGPRIISIVVLYPDSDRMSIFSLQRSAEVKGMEFSTCIDSERDNIEKGMLSDFFNEVKDSGINLWLHWNMKNDNFGFQTLSNRYKNLGGIVGAEMQFKDECTKNISTLFKMKYGPNYITGINDVKGKMYALFEKNGIADPDLLTGLDEIREFVNGNYVKVELSVVAKVKAFERLIDYARNGELKTDSKKIKDIYGFSLNGILQYVRENAVLAAAFSILSAIISTLICKAIGI